MEPRAGRTSDCFIRPRLVVTLFMQQGLHVHARLRTSEYDEVSHRA